jgi:hypothetical protein
MPRQARLDGPGRLHDVMIRGIEKRHIVDDSMLRRSDPVGCGSKNNWIGGKVTKLRGFPSAAASGQKNGRKSFHRFQDLPLQFPRNVPRE